MLLLLLLAPGLLGMLLWVFARHCGIAVGLLLATQVWVVVAGGQRAAVDLGISLYPTDILDVCALGVALARVPRWGPRARAALAALAALLALTAWSTLRGAAVFGPQMAGNDSRVYFWHFFAVTFYLATAPLNAALIRTVTRAWLAAAAVYALCAVARWADRGLYASNAHLAVDGVAVDARPVPAAAALVLAQAAALLVLTRRARPASRPDPAMSGAPAGARPAHRWGVGARHLAALALFALVVLLQHRTVWAAGAAMAVTWWLLRPSRGGQRLVSAGAGVLALCLAALLYAVGLFGAAGDALTASLAETQGTRSTFAWRVLGWQDLLAGPRSLAQWLLGAPFGSGYERFIGGGLVTVSPHDYYLHVVLRLGLAGLLALLVLYAHTWRRLAGGGAQTRALCVLLVSQLVLFVSYSAFPEQAVLLGLCLWRARLQAGAGKRPGPSAPAEGPAAPAPRAAVHAPRGPRPQILAPPHAKPHEAGRTARRVDLTISDKTGEG